MLNARIINFARFTLHPYSITQESCFQEASLDCRGFGICQFASKVGENRSQCSCAKDDIVQKKKQYFLTVIRLRLNMGMLP